MPTTQLPSEHPLARQLNLGEVTSWRLHWLLCDLWALQRDIQTTPTPRVAGLQEGPFADLLTRLKRVEAGYQRLRWETMTMLCADYDSHVEPLFASLSKHDDYAAELLKAKTLLQAAADKAFAEEAKRLCNSIGLPAAS